MEQGGNELNLLLHSFGELFGSLGQGVGNLHATGPGEGPLFGFIAGQSVQLAEEDELVEDLHLLVKPALLGQVTNPLEVLARKRLVKESDASRVRDSNAHHHANGAGFARSVGSEQAEHLAGFNRQAQVADGNLVLVGFGDSRELDNWHEFSRRTAW